MFKKYQALDLQSKQYRLQFHFLLTLYFVNLMYEALFYQQPKSLAAVPNYKSFTRRFVFHVQNIILAL